MEETIDSLIADMRDAEKEAAAHGVGAPKAIYVCKTNIVEGNSLQMDDPQAAVHAAALAADPDLAHLTEHCGVDSGRDRRVLLAEDEQGLPAAAGLPALQGRRQGLRRRSWPATFATSSST